MEVNVEVYLDPTKPDEPIKQTIDVPADGNILVRSSRGSEYAKFPDAPNDTLIVRFFPKPVEGPPAPPVEPEIYEWTCNGDVESPIDTLAGECAAFSQLHFNCTDKNGVNKSYSAWPTYLNAMDLRILYDGVDAGFTNIVAVQSTQGSFTEFCAYGAEPVTGNSPAAGVVVTIEATPRALYNQNW